MVTIRHFPLREKLASNIQRLRTEPVDPGLEIINSVDLGSKHKGRIIARTTWLYISQGGKYPRNQHMEMFWYSFCDWENIKGGKMNFGG